MTEDEILFKKAIGYERTIKTYEFGKLIKVEKKYVCPNSRVVIKWLKKYRKIKDNKTVIG